MVQGSMVVAYRRKKAGDTCPENRNTNKEITPEAAVRSGWEADNQNPPDERN